MRKVTLDQFFTCEEDAKRLIDNFDKRYPMKDFDFILEPSAGSGSFYNHLPSNKIGIDIEPMTSGIQKADFFQWMAPGGRIAVIGNPPFGRRGSLAKKFFQKCAQFAEVIGFIFPAIFGKPSFYKTLNKYFHLEHEEAVSRFCLPNGDACEINCVFQIWKRHELPRNDEELAETHEDFQMIHRHVAWTDQSELDSIAAEYHFAFGQVSRKINDIANVKKGSQFFVKDVSQHRRVRQIFEMMDFSHLMKYSMGAPSLSRNDIIKEYEKNLGSIDESD